MKRNIYLLVITCLTIVAIGAGAMYHSGNLEGSFNILTWLNDSHDDSADIKTEAELDEFSTISLNVESLEVTVESGDGYGYQFKGAENFRPEVTVENGTLTIGQSISGKTLNRTGEIVITVPEDTNLENMDMTISAGSVQIKDITASTLSVDVSAGDITLVDSAIDSLDVEASSGDVDVKGTTFNDLTSSLSEGDFDLVLAERINAFEISADAAMGSVSIDGDNQGSAYAQGGNGSKYITVDVALGDIDIQEK